MCDVFNRGALRLAVAQICQSMGWDSLQKSTQDLLTDVLQKYLEEIAKTTHEYCYHFCRTEPSLDDLGLAFDEIGIPVHELEDFVSQVDQVPFIHQLPRYPMPKGCVLHHPRNGEIVDRLEYYSDHLPPLIKVTEHVEDEGESLETQERSVNGDTNENETIKEIKTVGEETSNEPVSVKRPPESPPAYDGDVKRRRLDFAFTQKGLKTESELDILQALQGDVSSPSSTPSPDIGMLPAFRFPEKPLSEGETLPLEKSQQSGETKTAEKEKKKPLPKVVLKSPPSKLKSSESKVPSSETPSKVKSPAKKPASNTAKSPKANKNKPKNPSASKSLPTEPKLKSPDKPSSKSATKSNIKSPLKSPPVKSPVKSPSIKSPLKSPPIKSPPFQSPPSKTKAASSVPVLEKSAKSLSTPSPKSKAKQKPKSKAATDVKARVQSKKKPPKKGKKVPAKPKSSALPEVPKVSTKLAESSSTLREGDVTSPFVLPKLKIKPIKQEMDKMASYSISELIPEIKIDPSVQPGKVQKKKVKKPKASDGNMTSKGKPKKKIKIMKIKSEPTSPTDIKSPPSKPIVKPITIALPAAPEPLFSISSLLPPGSSGTTSSAIQDDIQSELVPHGFKKKKKKHKEKDKDKTKKKEKNKDKLHGHVKVKKEKVKETVAEPLPIPRLKLKLEPQATHTVGPPPEKRKKVAGLPQEPEFSVGASTSSQHSSSSAQPLPIMLTYQGKLASERIKEEMVQRTVITETLSSTFGYGEQIYYCPTCGLPDDGSPMIGCDGGCDEWYHWSCAGILKEPSADSFWVCPNCTKLKEKKKKKKKKSKP